MSDRTYTRATLEIAYPASGESPAFVAKYVIERDTSEIDVNDLAAIFRGLALAAEFPAEAVREAIP